MTEEPMTVGELKEFLAAHNVPDEALIWMETWPQGPREANGTAAVTQVNVEIGSGGYVFLNVMLPPPS